jgi:hypothetical protein
MDDKLSKEICAKAGVDRVTIEQSDDRHTSSLQVVAHVEIDKRSFCVSLPADEDLEDRVEEYVTSIKRAIKRTKQRVLSE